MAGPVTVIVSLVDEVCAVEDLFKEKDAYCKYYKLPSRPDYVDYDATNFFTILLREIYDPTLSLSNDVKLLKSTEFLISEGIDYQKAKVFGSAIATMVYKKISIYFQDMYYEDMCNVPVSIVNRYDLMLTFINQ